VAASELELRKTAEGGGARLEAVLLSIADAVLIVDAAGTTLFTTDAYTQFFGDPPGALIAQDMAGHPLTAEESPVQRTARGERFKMNVILRTKDGVERHFEAEGRPIEHAEGGSIGGVLILRDVTSPPLRLRRHRDVLGRRIRLTLPDARSCLEFHDMLAPPAPASGQRRDGALCPQARAPSRK
jgi:two-component system, chemotaxis family, CheB/CheR fusion protein